MGLPNRQRLYTAGEYLDLERQAEERHLFVDGQIYAMAGENLEHSTICFNLAGLLAIQLRGKPCRGLSPNMKIRSGPLSQKQGSGMFSYPDASVVCGEPRFHDPHRDVLLNPAVIFEVLSPSTENFDRGDKFLRYRTHLDSFGDYVLISTARPWVEHYRRQSGGTWLYTSLTGLEETLALDSIGCRLPLREIYDRIEFPPETPAEEAG